MHGRRGGDKGTGCEAEREGERDEERGRGRGKGRGRGVGQKIVRLLFSFEEKIPFSFNLFEFDSIQYELHFYSFSSSVSSTRRRSNAANNGRGRRGAAGRWLPCEPQGSRRHAARARVRVRVRVMRVRKGK